MTVKWETVKEDSSPTYVRKTYEITGTAGIGYVTADYRVTFDVGPETMIFRSNKDGEIFDWSELWQSYTDSVTDDSGIQDFCSRLETETQYKNNHVWIQCQRCGSMININTDGDLIPCACKAITVTGTGDYCKIMGHSRDWSFIEME